MTITFEPNRPARTPDPAPTPPDGIVAAPAESGFAVSHLPAKANPRFTGRRVIYVLGLLGLIGVLIGMVGNRFSRLAVPDAMVQANDLPVSISITAQLSRLAVQAGEKVQAGQVLFETDGGMLGPAVKSAAAQLITAQAERDSLLGQIEEERQRFSLYTEVARLQIERQKVKLLAMDAALARARRTLDQGLALLERRAISEEALRVSRDHYEQLQDQSSQDAAELKLLELNLKSAEAGRYFDGKEIQGRQGDLKNALCVAESRVGQAQQELENARLRLKEMAVVAPVSGSIYAIYRQPGEVLTPNLVVLSIDPGNRYSVAGRMHPDEASFVRPGMRVEVEIPSEKLVLNGQLGALGQRSLSASPAETPALEVRTDSVPFTVEFDNPHISLPPGARCVVRVPLAPLARILPR